MSEAQMKNTKVRTAVRGREGAGILPGIAACLAIAVPSWILGKLVPVMGGAVFAILIGMVLSLFWQERGSFEKGIGWTAKYVLQAAVVLLGFGMNFGVILQTGRESLPIIVCTISTSLILAAVMRRVLNIPWKTATLVGVGSSICGGSAIAATAPVIDADDGETAQAISVIFFYNVIAAIFFPILGRAIGFDTASGHAFGIFAGTAVNDTSSVTAAASTWDSMWNLGSQTLNEAVTVKLTRTLAIIPITLALSLHRARQAREDGSVTSGYSFRRSFPLFILWFVLAAACTTIALGAGVPSSVFHPVTELSKFLIMMAMAAIGLHSNVIKLLRSGGRVIALGGICWAGITAVSLLLQWFLGIW